MGELETPTPRTIPTAEELESKIGRLARRLSTDEGKMQVAMDPRTIPSGNWVMVRLARTSDAGNLIDTTAAKRQPILAGVVVKCGPGVDESKFYTGLGVNIFPAAATTITERVALVETMAIAFTFDVDAAIEGVE